MRAQGRFPGRLLRQLLVVLALAGAQNAARALDVQLLDAAGEPAASVALIALPLDGSVPPVQDPGEPAVMDQVNERFVPNLLVVRRGTPVSFPNSDQVRHHVYSFSEAKRFELPLYRGNHHAPVEFDREGLVVLGCNIHDHMVGYVLVVGSPWFGVSDDRGMLAIAGLPAGRYALQAWHPGMEVPLVVRQDLRLGGADERLTVEVPGGWHGSDSHGMAMSWDDY